MSKLIDAKGLGCTQPVILARNALELYNEITIVVDDRTALDNLKLLGMHAECLGMLVECLVDVSGKSGDIYWIRLRKTGTDWEKPGMWSNRPDNDSRKREL
jgi:TusA-related sulfurtransferase